MHQALSMCHLIWLCIKCPGKSITPWGTWGAEVVRVASRWQDREDSTRQHWVHTDIAKSDDVYPSRYFKNTLWVFRCHRNAIGCQIVLSGLADGSVVWKYLLFLWRAWAWLPAPIWGLTTLCNSSSLWGYQEHIWFVYIHVHRQNTHTYKLKQIHLKFLKIILSL